jgi:Flp pilus assembly protein TadD
MRTKKIESTFQDRWPRGRRLGLGALLLALVALGAGCSSLNFGFLNFSRLKFWKTEKTYSDVEVRPASGDTARLLRNAHYLSLMGRRELALKELEEAFQREPQNLKVANALARGYEEVGEWERAQQIYREALSRNGENPALHNNLCYSYYQAGNFKKAEACFRQALERDPQNVAARNNLGLLLARTGRREEARRLWQEAEGEVAAEKRLKDVAAFLAGGGSGRSPAVSVAAAAKPSGKPPEMAAAPREVRGTTPVPAPSEARPQVVKAAQTTSPAPDRDKAVRPPAPEVAAPAVPPSGKSAAPDAVAKAGPASPPAGSAPLKTAAAQAPREKRARPLSVKELVETNIRLENGNGFPHLARDTRDFLSVEGFNVVSIANYVDFGVEDTVIYYRPEAAKLAKVLGEKFFQTANLKVNEELPEGIKVRVIMGHDLLLKEDLLAKLAG